MFEGLRTNLTTKTKELQERDDAVFETMRAVKSEDHQSISFTAKIDNVEVSIGDLHTRANTLISLIGTITEARDDELLPVSTLPISELLTHVTQASAEAERVRNALTAFLGGTVTTVDPDTATLKGQNGEFRLTAELKGLATSVDAALERNYPTSCFLRSLQW